MPSATKHTPSAPDIAPPSKAGGANRTTDFAASVGTVHAGVDPKAALQKLYPSLSEGKLETAFANLLRYSEIALAIGAKRSGKSKHLTGSDPIPTMKERSNVSLKE